MKCIVQIYEELQLVLFITRLTSKIYIPYLTQCNLHISLEERLFSKQIVSSLCLSTLVMFE